MPIMNKKKTILKFDLTCFSSASTNWPVLDNTVVTVTCGLTKQIVGVIMEGHYCLLLFILFLCRSIN